MDSVVLLHLLHTLAPRFEWQLSALHVHHGISPNADTWADFCAGLCIRHNIPLHIERVNITPLRAEHGIEAAARKLRHASFAGQNCDFVALAHHADDQAETLLLQLLRGAGIKGVAAMPLLKPATAFAPATLRPLLDIPRSTLLEYAHQHSLQWVEDESNADDSYPRNFLRHRLLPIMEQRFPAYRDTLTRSAQHFAEAGELLDELAQQDAQGWSVDSALDVSRLRVLSYSRAKNLLRYFLHKHNAPMPQAAQLDDMLRQLCDAREDAAVCVEFGSYDTLLPARGKPVGSPLLRSDPSALAKPAAGGIASDLPASGLGRLTSSSISSCPATLDETTGHSTRPPKDGSQVAAYPAPEGCAPPCQGGRWQVRRYQDRVYLMRTLGQFDKNLVLPWNGEAELEWPAMGGAIAFRRIQDRGISCAKLQRAPVTLRLRSGGESLRPHPGVATRSLKNLLQEHHVQPWLRERMPLLYCGDELVCVVGVAISAEYQARQNEEGMLVCCEQLDYDGRHKFMSCRTGADKP